MAISLRPFVEQKLIVELGRHQATGREDWWYPTYIGSLCPNLPDWQALNACAKLFSQDKNSDIGIYYAGPWKYLDADIIRALKLNFTITRFDSDQELNNKLQQAINQKQPIVMLNWSPNWTDILQAGKFVEFPEHHPLCETKPEWGPNPERIHDCGNIKNGWLKKVAWPKLDSYSPCIYQFISNISFTKEMIAEAAALMVVDGQSEAQAAQQWRQRYQKQLNNWLPKQCNY